MEDQNETHHRCLYSEINCHPQEIVDFENLYTNTPSNDFLKIGAVLDALNDVEVISSQARACVLHNVFNRTGHQDLNMHQGSRPFPELIEQYVITVPQFARLYNRTIELRNKYSTEPYSSEGHANVLVNILNSYIASYTNEFNNEVDLFLEEFVADELEDPGCQTSVGIESTVCAFMMNKVNHDVFSNGFYPDNFPYESWLKVNSYVVVLRLTIVGWCHCCC